MFLTTVKSILVALSRRVHKFFGYKGIVILLVYFPARFNPSLSHDIIFSQILINNRFGNGIKRA